MYKFDVPSSKLMRRDFWLVQGLSGDEFESGNISGSSFSSVFAVYGLIVCKFGVHESSLTRCDFSIVQGYSGDEVFTLQAAPPEERQSESEVPSPGSMVPPSR